MTHEKDDIDRIAERLGAHPLDDPESRDRGFDKEFEGAREGHVFRLYAHRLEIASPPHITLHIAVSLPNDPMPPNRSREASRQSAPLWMAASS